MRKDRQTSGIIFWLCIAVAVLIVVGITFCIIVVTVYTSITDYIDRVSTVSKQNRILIQGLIELDKEQNDRLLGG